MVLLLVHIKKEWDYPWQRYWRLHWLFFMSVWMLGGCNITYKVRDQSNEIDHILYMPCGKVTIELVGKGNSKFVLKQHFDLDNKVIVMTDSMQISYNGHEVFPEFNVKNENGTGVEVENSFDLHASFELNEGVFDGDTILVYARDYLDCSHQLISMDTLIYRFMNNFRIRGINFPDDDL